MTACPSAQPRTVLPADWQPQQIARLWSYWGSRQHHLEQYFSRQVGHGVVAFLKHTGRLRGKALDYGCGPGFLLDHLLKAGLECWGADTSPRAVEQTNSRLAGRDRWHGATLLRGFPSPFAAASFDVVTCLETLEHLDDATLRAVLSEVHRLTAPGGLALFTTPNSEDLARNTVYCPFCDSEFHRVQHVRSITPGSLRATLAGAGFDVLFCQGLNFADFQRDTLVPVLDLSLRTMGRIGREALRRLLDRLAPRKFPEGRSFRGRLQGPSRGHLCAVVTPRTTPVNPDA